MPRSLETESEKEEEAPTTPFALTACKEELSCCVLFT
jgi:hypothetical protein